MLSQVKRQNENFPLTIEYVRLQFRGHGEEIGFVFDQIENSENADCVLYFFYESNGRFM